MKKAQIILAFLFTTLLFTLSVSADNSICGEGNIYNGFNTTTQEYSCTAVFTADTRDGYVFAHNITGEQEYTWLNPPVTWDEFRLGSWHNALVHSRDYTNDLLLININEFVPGYPPLFLYAQYTYYDIFRISLPFDTSSLPDTAYRINSATLTLTTRNTITNFVYPSNSNDFIVIVPTYLENSPNLSVNDFDNFGPVDNPIELSDRFDVSENTLPVAVQNISIELNSMGKSKINRNGYTVLGIRAGHELYEYNMSQGYYTDWYSMRLMMSFNSAENPTGKPTLIVNYTIPEVNVGSIE